VRLALAIFPFPAAYPREAGFALLEQGGRDDDAGAMKASLPYLRRAIRCNTLDYRSRYYLAKSYLRLSAEAANYFDLGVSELRHAARIRRGNKQVVLDCSRLFFSLWPLLEKEDQDFTVALLTAVMPTVSWSEFSPLIETWSLYVKDTPLLMELLRSKPEFLGPAASQLVAAGIPIKKRWEMLALYEIHALDTVERLYNEFGLQGEIGLDNALSLLNQLRAIKGYHRLGADSGFNQEKQARLRRALLIHVIGSMLAGAENDSGRTAQLRELIDFYISEHSGLNELDQLQKLLKDRGYFKDNDFPSLRLKVLIAYKKGGYNGVIAEIEALRNGISFVKKEQKADYTDILLMLVDSYYSTKLLTAAEAVAGELYREQPDNPDVLWRILRVRKILGGDGSADPALDAKLAAVENSRFMTAVKANAAADVYLFDQAEIEIVIDPVLRAKLEKGQLVQAFVDGKIAFESYAESLPEKIVIGAPFLEIESKVKVQIVIFKK
jgi:hypothetical protein